MLAEPDGTSMFQLAGGNVTDTDTGSGVNTSRAYEWSATFQPDPVENGPPTTPFPIAVTPAPGNESAEVQWPARTSWKAGSGTAMVRVWDNAGNMGTARITLVVRDRQAPKVVKPRVVKADRRKRVTLRAACSEPGTLRMEFRNQTRAQQVQPEDRDPDPPRQRRPQRDLEARAGRRVPRAVDLHGRQRELDGPVRHLPVRLLIR